MNKEVIALIIWSVLLNLDLKVRLYNKTDTLSSPSLVHKIKQRFLEHFVPPPPKKENMSLKIEYYNIILWSVSFPNKYK